MISIEFIHLHATGARGAATNIRAHTQSNRCDWATILFNYRPCHFYYIHMAHVVAIRCNCNFKSRKAGENCVCLYCLCFMCCSASLDFCAQFIAESDATIAIRKCSNCALCKFGRNIVVFGIGYNWQNTTAGNAIKIVGINEISSTIVWFFVLNLLEAKIFNWFFPVWKSSKIWPKNNAIT